MWATVGQNLARYKNYPRIVGETGGKDFVFAHVSADVPALVTALIRGAFEYQGQKCSAASRAYVPESLWPQVRGRLLEELSQVRMGDPTDFSNFMGAVIDAGAFRSIGDFIAHARTESGTEIVAGGGTDDSTGWFIEPTVVLARDPGSRLMREEIFGPVLTVYVYRDADFERTLELCESGSDYALTGAVFARDRGVIAHMADVLRYAAGNFYINDKPTGAIVDQQPFGGARASGTNDKAGSKVNLLRWVSPRAIKESFVPTTRFGYPYMEPER
jgi:1-pyrroline-5-carboxylate dehydrogenase